MGFTISKFAEQFKNTINWMLKNEHSEEIKDDLQFFKDNRGECEKNTDSVKALRMIIELIVTNGWRLRKPIDFDSKMNSFIKNHKENFRTREAKDELIKLVGQRKEKNIEQLFKYSRIKEFTEELYRLAKEGETEVLGEKGRDNYLRDFGFWDRIPIDRHEMRFILRSGIYHACSIKEKSDPLEKGHFQDVLTSFCAKYLKGYKVEGIDLGTSPGIVDIFIWSYCAGDRYRVCINIPNCEKCNHKEVCLYAVTNSP